VSEERRRGLVFGEAADLYDRRRPTYPAAAIDHILAAAPGARELLDIGCGTGKATVLFAARGLHVTGIEADPAMASVARRNLPSATVVTTRFEDWDAPADVADIVVSAQAWHWVDHAVGMPKLVHVLRPGGIVAIMSNTPRDGGMDMRAELDPIYWRLAPTLVETGGMLNWSGQFEEFREEFTRSGLFDLLEPWQFDWDSSLDAESYGELMQTHSDHRMLGPELLGRLVDEVRARIDAAGGVITMRYRTVVILARTPA
jgi:SAM-dependent methyltransferase